MHKAVFNIERPILDVHAQGMYSLNTLCFTGTRLRDFAKWDGHLLSKYVNKGWRPPISWGQHHPPLRMQQKYLQSVELATDNTPYYTEGCRGGFRAPL
jgi:hypothetical protein